VTPYYDKAGIYPEITPRRPSALWLLGACLFGRHSREMELYGGGLYIVVDTLDWRGMSCVVSVVDACPGRGRDGGAP
jgi:hypothetical protein